MYLHQALDCHRSVSEKMMCFVEQPIFAGAGRVPLQDYSQGAWFGIRLEVLGFLEYSMKKQRGMLQIVNRSGLI